MIRQIVQTTLIGLVALLAQPAFCEHPEISGSWQLDVAASTFGSTALPDSGMMTVSNGSHKTLHIEVALKGPRQERTEAYDWKVDNKFHPVVGDDPGSLLAKWDGAVLTGLKQTDGGMQEIRLVVDAGGGSLTQTIQSPQGAQTLIWRRR